MQPFVCLIDGFRAEASQDCRHCGLPLLDERLDEARVAIVKADDARRHKQEQRLLWIAVGVTVFVFVVAQAVIVNLRLPIPGLQLGAGVLLMGFGIWRGLIKAAPPLVVATPLPQTNAHEQAR